MNASHFAATAALTACLAATLQAQQPREPDTVIPSAFATVEGPEFDTAPFGQSSARRDMELFGPSLLGTKEAVRIRGIRFRPGGTINSIGNGSYDLAIDLSTSSRTPATRSMTFDDNHGADRTNVFDGVVAVAAQSTTGSPSPFAIYIPFDRTFEWDPMCGPLTLDIVYRSSTPATTALDAVDVGADLGAKIAAFGTNPSVATASNSTVLVTSLVLETETVPDAYESTNGSTWTVRPFGISEQASRLMDVYAASEMDFDGRTRITQLTWRVEGTQSYPGATYEGRITMSTTSANPNSLSTTFDNNHGSDKRVVFEGQITAEPQGTGTGARPWTVVCTLDTPFEYNPNAGSLVIDWQGSSTTMTSNVRFDAAEASLHSAGRVFAVGANPSTGAIATSPIVVGVIGEPIPTVPEAGDLTDLTAASRRPFNNTNNQPIRSMVLYRASAMANDKPVYIQHLRFRGHSATEVYGPTTFTGTVDLSTGPISVLSGVFDNNHGANRVRAFDGSFSTEYVANPGIRDFPIEIRLDEPFLWDPADGSLIVDMRVTERVGPGIELETGDIASFGRHIFDGTNANSTVATTANNLVPTLSLGGSSVNIEPLIYDNGPVVTNPGEANNGADGSVREGTWYGIPADHAAGQYVADDFVVCDLAGWTLETIALTAYEIGTGRNSTIDGVHIRILNGPPNGGGVPVAGSPLLGTNLLTPDSVVNNCWSGAFRTDLGDLATNTDRYLMDVQVKLANPITLPPGTYWIQYGLTGGPASGPFVPPVTVLGRLDTGNARRFFGGAWSNWTSSPSFAGQAAPFRLFGSRNDEIGSFTRTTVGCTAAQLDVRGSSTIGGFMRAELSNPTAGSFSWIGVDITSYGSGLPLCTCFVGHPFSVLSFGANYEITVPNNPTLCGAELFFQGLEYGAGTCPILPIELTDTIRAAIR